MSRRNTRKETSEQSQTNRRDNTSRGEYAVKYPQEYVSHAKHPIATSARGRIPVKGAEIAPRYSVGFSISAVSPIDRDEEIVDTAVNNYRLIKSLTSGARYYTTNTVLAYMFNLRALVLVAHEFVGRLKALRTFDRVGDPSLYAYRARTPFTTLAAESDSTLIGDIPRIEAIYLEMLSDLNAIPVFESGEFTFMGELFLQAFLDESHPGGDLYSPHLFNVQYAEYDDVTKTLTGMSDNQLLREMNFDGLYELFVEIRETFVASRDMSNLSADMLGVLPSSRKDWSGHFDVSVPYMVPLSRKFATMFGSADILGVPITAPDTVNDSGDRIVPGKLDLPVWSTANDSHGRLLSCAEDELELSAMMLTYHSDDDETLSTGYALLDIYVLHYQGSGAPSRYTFSSWMASTTSTTQSTAEQSFKCIAAIWSRYNCLPKVYFDDYGSSRDWANVLWSPNGIREIPMADFANTVKVLNSINHTCINTAIRDR